MKIKEILTIDLSEDIKNVIDLEDLSEAEIQAEIENYIITDGLAKEYSDFVATFTSNLVETGVWISGFYGSGKSYFGKLLGYMLSNQNITGTPARDRILQRFTGIQDEELIKNIISRLSSENCRVVFLDVAKQDTSKGLAYTLFRNFLKSLGLPENEHGFLLYQLMVNENQPNIATFIQSKLGKDWSKIRTKLIEYAKATKVIFLQNGSSDADYEQMMTTIRRDIDQFSASRLREEVCNYIEISNSEKIVFIFDEASEAISQNKFNLLDLEGISESLSSLRGKVWTIAIAQEKLDDVINNANVSKAQLTKVTDRFKTKIHLEATEVDVIIRNRLLNKKDNAVQKLKDHYSNNSGKIIDLATLQATGISKTGTVDSYITYYPFYKYQFDLMQNFLFGTKGYASTKVAARGMIITTYDILKRELQEKDLFETATGWQIVKQAQPQPPVKLVNRYDNGERILKEAHSKISGRKLLEAIWFLSESEVVPATLANIIKVYIATPEDFFKIQGEMVKALTHLVDAKIVLLTNNIYRITTDIEQRLLDELAIFNVQSFVKKKQAVTAFKNSAFIKSLANISEGNLQYDFYITTDNDDELTNPAKKYLKIKVKSLYSISDNRNTDIDTIKTQTQNDKDLVWLVPDNSSFNEIDKLIDEIERTTYLEEKYNNPQTEEGSIVRKFSLIKSEKEVELKRLIEESLQNATAIYLYNTFQLDKLNWQATLQAQQRNVIQNVYDKRLSSNLGDDLASKIIKEANANRLHTFFTAADFKFFDTQGNFIGEKLRVTEEIVTKIKNTFVDGSTLEKELEKPPTGFTFGAVISTVATLMRAGKVVANHNGAEKFSWRDEGVSDIFNTARTFRNAKFKAIAKSLTAHQINEIVTTLQGLDFEGHVGTKIDWNTNDFDLVNAIKELAKRFCDKVGDMRRQNKEFDKIFHQVSKHKDTLCDYTGAVSEANYIDKAETFLANKDSYSESIETIEKVEKFIGNKLPKLKIWRAFVTGVNDELLKAAKTNPTIQQLSEEFDALYAEDVVKNYADIEQKAQKIKDEYFQLMQTAASDMADKYSLLKQLAEKLIAEINTLPFGLNEQALQKATRTLQYATSRTNKNVEIEFDIKDKTSRFTYSEMLSSIELFNAKKAELEIAKAGLIKEEPPIPGGGPGGGGPEPPKTYTTNLPSKNMKVKVYRKWLSDELKRFAGTNDDDDVKISE